MNARSSEDYIASESAEINAEQNLNIHWFFKAFPAFKSRNYSLYFVGQFVSMIGTWLQMVAQGWLVLTLTDSPFLIGLVAALMGLPSILFSLIGGYVIDRYSKKKILIIANTAAMVLAMILGIFTLLGIVNIWHIAILAFLLGIITAIDIPARQAYVYELVERNQVASAVAMNAAIFNGGRVIGPAMAGVLIALAGTGGAFIINGVSYIPAIFTLILINAKVIVNKSDLHPIRAIREGISYAASHPIIKNLFVLTVFISIFGWSHTTIMPVIAKRVFNFDAAGLGYLFAASGVGALVGTIIVSAFSQKINPWFFILGGNVIFAVGLILFSYSSIPLVAMFFLFVANLGLLLEFATINTTIQHNVQNQMRGRVMSLYILMFLGSMPLGSFQIGYVAETLGTGSAIRLGAAVMLLIGFYMMSQMKKLHASHEEYKSKAAGL